MSNITGIWLRRDGYDHAEVLAEIDGEWRVLIRERLDGPFSHIKELYPVNPGDDAAQESGGEAKQLAVRLSLQVVGLRAQLARAEKVMRQIADMEGQEWMTDSLFVARTLAMLNAYLA